MSSAGIVFRMGQIEVRAWHDPTICGPSPRGVADVLALAQRWQGLPGQPGWTGFEVDGVDVRSVQRMPPWGVLYHKSRSMPTVLPVLPLTAAPPRPRLTPAAATRPEALGTGSRAIAAIATDLVELLDASGAAAAAVAAVARGVARGAAREQQGAPVAAPWLPWPREAELGAAEPLSLNAASRHTASNTATNSGTTARSRGSSAATLLASASTAGTPDTAGNGAQVRAPDQPPRLESPVGQPHAWADATHTTASDAADSQFTATRDALEAGSNASEVSIWLPPPPPMAPMLALDGPLLGADTAVPRVSADLTQPPSALHARATFANYEASPSPVDRVPALSRLPSMGTINAEDSSAGLSPRDEGPLTARAPAAGVGVADAYEALRVVGAMGGLDNSVSSATRPTTSGHAVDAQRDTSWQSVGTSPDGWQVEDLQPMPDAPAADGDASQEFGDQPAAAPVRFSLFERVT